MESRAQPLKSISFSSTTSSRDDKRLRDSDRNLSLDSVKYGNRHQRRGSDNKPPVIDEEREEEEEEVEDETTLATISDDIDNFIATIRDSGTDEVPDTVHKFIELVEKEVCRYEAGVQKWSVGHALLPAVDRLATLASMLEPKHFDVMSRAGGGLHTAMCFLEEEFFSVVNEPRTKQKQQDQQCTVPSKAKRGQSFNRINELQDHCLLPQQSPVCSDASPFPAYAPEAVARMHAIAGAMSSAGYETECCQVFAVARRNALDTSISDLGFEKVSIDDVQRMAWDSLEAEIAKWIKAFSFIVTDALPHERDLCGKVFNNPIITTAIIRNLASTTVVSLLAFAEAVAITKRSAEKLFKVLDMYDCIRDLSPQVEHLINTEGDSILKSEIASAKSSLGEVAVAIFCDLEGSIKSDTSKTPVPSGAVHPLTRYVMNYLRYSCEYKSPLEQCFKDHENVSNVSNSTNKTPFAAQLLSIMDLLHSNIQTKSKLYRDLALSNIFMMNNVRYMAQKIKGSPDMNQLLGETWYRKRSSEVRQYHKNYQRETWGRVLACFKDEGITVKGTVQKPVLKEKLKAFNAMFEEIHKVQSSWVVSDEQMQSELRVSVSAVVVPAYRSFLGRFGQYLDPGRQTEKYVKFGVEDLENYIDELFGGNQNSMGKKRT